MPVEVSTQGDVRVLTLDNPAKRNALDPQLCASLAQEIGAAAAGARALVLTGTGDKAFCAGFDLDALAEAEAAFPQLIQAVAGSRLPIVCALNGVAFGGGAELAVTCDLRVAHPEVRFSMPPARLGIVYHPTGLARFAALAGESRARELFLTARVIDVDTAERWGLVDHVVPDDQVLAKALALAGEMAQLAPLAVQGMRRSFEILLAARATPPPGLTAELEALMTAAWKSDDAREAIAALVEKRAPVFRGR
jgi:enoyl-CoA hydratase/carnithine racemase